MVFSILLIVAYVFVQNCFWSTSNPKNWPVFYWFLFPIILFYFLRANYLFFFRKDREETNARPGLINQIILAYISFFLFLFVGFWHHL